MTAIDTANPLFARVARLPMSQRVLASLRTAVGRVLLTLVFTGMLAGLKFHWWWQTGMVLLLTSALPSYRRVVLAIAAVAWVALSPPLDLPLLTELATQRGGEAWVRAWPIVVASTWLFAFAYLWTVRRFPKSPVGRRPVLTLVAILVALLALTSVQLRGGWWFAVTATAMVLGRYLWFFAYWISDNLPRDKHPGATQVGFWRPFWGFTSVPYGKGQSYLDRVVAKDDDQLSKVQLSGLRLLFWAAAWTIVLMVATTVLYGPHAPRADIPVTSTGWLPTYPMALEAQVNGAPYPWHVRWLSLIAYFMLRICRLTIWGHKIVAICRMAGFNVFRNTYRPFGATSIAEFYNRIYYYFKELLVAFFFYPTYLRYFKKHPRLRLFAATLAAAGLGNFAFHFLREDEPIFRHGLFEALLAYHSYAIYALILGTVIGLSQLRVLKPAKSKRPMTGHRRVLAVAGVLLFYSLVAVFDDDHPRPVVDYGSYLLSLFRP